MSDSQRSMNSNEGNMVIDLRKVAHMLNKWKIFIVVFTLLVTIGEGIISYFFITPIYQAKTLLMVTVASEKLQVTTNSMVRTDPTTGNPLPVLTMNTYLGQLKSDIVMNRVIAALGLSTSPGSLAGRIQASIVKDSNLIEVKVNDSNPEVAAAIANSVSDEYLKLMKEFMFSSVVVISPANIPSSPIKPDKQLNIIVAFMLGLILSFLLVFLLEYIDNTFKNSEDVERELDLPVLGLIPLRTDSNTRQSTYGGSL